MKKYFAEFLGTFWLVFGGCGSAVLAAAFGGTESNLGIGFVGVALTFGITGTVLLFSDDGAEEDSAAVPTLTPFAGTKGGGMAATWIF